MEPKGWFLHVKNQEQFYIDEFVGVAAHSKTAQLERSITITEGIP